MPRDACTTTRVSFDRLLQACTSDPAASLRSLSRRLGVHPHTLTQVVRERTGTQLLGLARASAHRRRACHLLRTRPDLSIKEVAAAVGFNTTSVFDRFLRRACGRSPSECRSLAPAASGGSCADRPGADRRAPDRHRRRSTFSTRASTIEGIQPSAADATLESFAASSRPRRPAPRRDLGAAHQAAGGTMSNAQGKPMAIACAMALAIAVPSIEADVRAAAAGPAGSLESVQRRRDRSVAAVRRRRAASRRRTARPPTTLPMGADAVAAALEDHDGGDGQRPGTVRDADRGDAGDRRRQ